MAPIGLALHVMFGARGPHSITTGVDAGCGACVDMYEIHFLKDPLEGGVGSIGVWEWNSPALNPEPDGEVQPRVLARKYSRMREASHWY